MAAIFQTPPGKTLYVKMLGSDFVLFRDKAGNPACLSNACPHRGSSLSNGSCNEEGMIVCPFHGWTYALDGTLCAAPKMEDAAEFSMMDYGLIILEELLSHMQD